MNLYNINQILPLHPPTKITAKYKTKSLHLCGGTGVCIKLQFSCNHLLNEEQNTGVSTCAHDIPVPYFSVVIAFYFPSHNNFLQNSGCFHINGIRGPIANSRVRTLQSNVRGCTETEAWALHYKAIMTFDGICEEAEVAWRNDLYGRNASTPKVQSLNFYKHLWLYHLSSVNFHEGWGKQSEISFHLYHDFWIIPSCFPPHPVTHYQATTPKPGLSQRNFM